jgi:hypothetical protein
MKVAQLRQIIKEEIGKVVLSEGIFSSDNESKARLSELEEKIKNLNWLFDDIIKKGLPTNNQNLTNLVKIKKELVDNAYIDIKYLIDNL